jgi:hypothetical protein
MNCNQLAARTIYGSATQMGAQKLAAISKELETDAALASRSQRRWPTSLTWSLKRSANFSLE